VKHTIAREGRTKVKNQFCRFNVLVGLAASTTLAAASFVTAAAGGGANNVVARNQNGVQLVMRGRQAGLEASLDLGGTRIKLKR
jgi:uncharacterized protein YfiM (DUF2279 family)